jgi:hypothetical protein
MSLVHMGVALGLSASAALVVTGAAMRPIKPDLVAYCMAVPGRAASSSVCMTTGTIERTGSGAGGGSMRLDTDRRDRDRRFSRYSREPFADCHRDVRTHYVPGYGVISHLHVGPDCKVRKAYRSGSG